MKILFISEALSLPFDEGIKNVAFSIHNQLKVKAKLLTVTKKENITDDLDILKICLNKLFINNGLKSLLKQYLPDIILYLPEASITFNSFIRAKTLKLMSKRSKVFMLGVKHIEYSFIEKKVISKLLKPDCLLLLGRFGMDFFLNAGIKVEILPPAVDSSRFYQATAEEKSQIRRELGLSNEKIVILHVGHIRPTRNVQCLMDLQNMDNIQVVIVGSTSTDVDIDLHTQLVRNGVMVINKTVLDISMIYKMADIYVFPVMNKIACIDMPLSILEASACNLPVVTTKFGGLPNYFKEDRGFRYFDTFEELVELIEVNKNIEREDIDNRKKVKPYSWDMFANKILNEFNGVM